MSPSASPSISEPNCDHSVPSNLYILTWPESVPLPLFFLAPIAKIDPLEESEIEIPDQSPAASPFISDPIWIQFEFLYW